MKLNKKKAGLAAGVLAGVTMLVAPAAMATSSYTITVDGSSAAGNVNVTGVNKGTLAFVTDVTPAVPASCTTSSIAGTIARGTVVSTPGTQIGKVTNLTFGTTTACTATTLNYPVVITKSTKTGSTDWPIIVTALPAKGSNIVPIRIDNIDVKLQSTSKTGSPASYVCDLRARGSVTGTFDRSTQRITIAPPAGTYPINNIEAYDGNGTKTAGSGQTCGGQIWTGDSARMTGSFTLATPAPVGGFGISWF